MTRLSTNNLSTTKARRTRWPVLAVALVTLVGYGVASPVAAYAGTATLTGITMPASPVDSTGGAQVVDVTVHLQADVDVTGVYAVLTGPIQAWPYFQLAEGQTDAADADWVATVEVPQYLPEGGGTVTLDQLEAYDGSGATVASYDDAGLTATGFTHTFTATGLTDSTAPTVTSVTVDPATVDVSSGPADTAFTVTGTDAETGLVSGSLTLLRSDGQVLNPELYVPDGSAPSDGVLTGSAAVGPYYHVGVWVLSELRLRNGVGTETYYDADALADLGITATLVVQGPADEQAPVLTGLTFAPDPVDVSAEKQTVTAHLSLSDVGVGATFVAIELTGPGTTAPTLYANWASDWYGAEPITDGTLDLAMDVPAQSNPGAWQVTTVSLSDALGNERGYTATTLPVGSNIDRTLQVVNTQVDTTAPVVTDVQLEPTTVDVSAGPADVTVTIQITDDLSGWTYGGYSLRNPSGAQTTLGDELSPGGTPVRDGTFTQSLTVPAGAPAGTWGLFSLWVRDAAGNSRTYDVTAPPADATFAVVDTAAPTAPATPGEVSATARDGAADVSWGITPDGGSPITRWDVDVATGSTVTVRHLTATPETSTGVTVTGLTNGASYTFRVTAVNAVGASEPSAWTDPVRPRGLPTAPAGVTASGSTGQATVSWSAPSSNGGAAVLAYEVTRSDGQGTVVTTAVGPTVRTLTATVTTTSAWTFSVRALNAAGAGPWSTAAVRPTTLTPSGTKTAGKLTVRLTSGTTPLSGETVTLTRTVVNPPSTSSATYTTTSTGLVTVKVPKAPKGTQVTYAWSYAGGVGYFPSTASVG